MPRSQRSALLAVAALVLLGAFFVLRPTAEDGTSPRSGTVAPGPSTPATVSTPAAAQGPLLTAARVTRLRVAKGDTVRFAVRSDTADEVHVHGYDLMRDAPAGKTVPVRFRADIEGIFEIELERAGRQIAELRVDP